ncbi:gluconate kinase, partial [Staphylococcus condimenti]
MKYMIGVDGGTTSSKSVLYDENGNFLRKQNIGYDMKAPDVDSSEENPDEIFDSVVMTSKA